MLKEFYSSPNYDITSAHLGSSLYDPNHYYDDISIYRWEINLFDD